MAQRTILFLELSAGIDQIADPALELFQLQVELLFGRLGIHGAKV